jgi:hypothetical protein
MTSETMTSAQRRRMIARIADDEFGLFSRARPARFLCLRLHGALFCAGVLSQGQSNHATFADCGGVREPKPRARRR